MAGFPISIKFLAPLGVVDATGGGIAMGRKHSEGGIPVYCACDKEGYFFQQICEIEGGEYVLNPYATFLYRDRIAEINSDSCEDRFLSYDEISDVSNILDIGYTKKVLVFPNAKVAIINHASTTKYLHELDDLNSKAKAEYFALKGKGMLPKL